MGLTVADWAWSVLSVLSIPALVALNGLFVAAEFSLVAVRRTRVEELVNRGVRGAAAVDQAIHRLDRTLAATQLGITLSSIGIGWAGEPALARLLQPLFESLPGIWAGVSTPYHRLRASPSALITFMHVGLRRADAARPWPCSSRTARRCCGCPPLVVFAKLTRPLILLMSRHGQRLLRLLGFEPPHGEQMVHSVEELLLLIEDTEEAGILDAGPGRHRRERLPISSKKVRDVHGAGATRWRPWS